MSKATHALIVATLSAPNTTSSQTPSSPQISNQLDMDIAVVIAALITAAISLATTLINLRIQRRIEQSRQELERQLQHEKRNHEIAIENLRADNEHKLKNQPRRLEFIGFWRKMLYKDATTYEDILKEESYKTLEKFIASEVCAMLQKEIEESKEKLEKLNKSLEWKEKVYNGKWWDEDEAEYQLQQDLVYYSKSWMEYEGDYVGILEALESMAETRHEIYQIKQDLTTLMKTQLIEELRRLETEEWKLLS
ncbi:MAG: hypothetical protein ACHWZW_14385 [Spirulina sp.]